MSAFDKLDPAARRAAFAHMSAADKVAKSRKRASSAERRMTQAKRAEPLNVSHQYVRTGRPSSTDVATLVEAYKRMHGRPPSAAQLARLRKK